jgi:hypothetical protein
MRSSLKLSVALFALILSVYLLASARSARSSFGEIGRYQITAVHSDQDAHGSMGDSVYRVDTTTGQICHLGSGLGPTGISDCH